MQDGRTQRQIELHQASAIVANITSFSMKTPHQFCFRVF